MEGNGILLREAASVPVVLRTERTHREGVEVLDRHRGEHRVDVGRLRGDAAVDPKDPRKTCQYCDLPALCRIFESGLQFGGGEESDDG